jgi:pilus assembly protein FimV
MAENEDNWGEIDLNPPKEEKPKVEFEVEEEAEVVEEEAEADIEVEIEEEPEAVEEAEPVVEEPKELEGIETQGAQKRIRNLVKQRKEKESENEELKQRIAAYEAKVKEQEAVLSSTYRNNIETTEARLTEMVSSAEDSYRRALESGEPEDILKAQRSLNRAELDLRDVGNNKRRIEQADSQRVEQTAAAPQTNMDRPHAPDPSAFHPKAVQWASSNDEWFGKDQIMTASALAINAKLIDEGYDEAEDDFYEALDKELRATLPSKFKAEEPAEVEVPEVKAPKKPSQVVGGASRTVTNPNTSRGNKVKLTKADVEIAKKWRIPLERYAQRKLQADQADGEYTEIVIDNA